MVALGHCASSYEPQNLCIVAMLVCICINRLLNVNLHKIDCSIVLLSPSTDGANESAQKDFLGEAQMLAAFDHPNVMRLLKVVTKNDPMLVVISYMANGDLKNYLKRWGVYCGSYNNYNYYKYRMQVCMCMCSLIITRSLFVLSQTSPGVFFYIIMNIFYDDPYKFT